MNVVLGDGFIILKLIIKWKTNKREVGLLLHGTQDKGSRLFAFVFLDTIIIIYKNDYHYQNLSNLHVFGMATFL